MRASIRQHFTLDNIMTIYGILIISFIIMIIMYSTNAEPTFWCYNPITNTAHDCELLHHKSHQNDLPCIPSNIVDDTTAASLWVDYQRKQNGINNIPKCGDDLFQTHEIYCTNITSPLQTVTNLQYVTTNQLPFDMCLESVVLGDLQDLSFPYQVNYTSTTTSTSSSSTTTVMIATHGKYQKQCPACPNKIPLPIIPHEHGPNWVCFDPVKKVTADCIDLYNNRTNSLTCLPSDYTTTNPTGGLPAKYLLNQQQRYDCGDDLYYYLEVHCYNHINPEEQTIQNITYVLENALSLDACECVSTNGLLPLLPFQYGRNITVSGSGVKYDFGEWTEKCRSCPTIIDPSTQITCSECFDLIEWNQNVTDVTLHQIIPQECSVCQPPVITPPEPEPLLNCTQCYALNATHNNTNDINNINNITLPQECNSCPPIIIDDDVSDDDDSSSSTDTKEEESTTDIVIIKPSLTCEECYKLNDTTSNGCENCPPIIIIDNNATIPVICNNTNNNNNNITLPNIIIIDSSTYPTPQPHPHHHHHHHHHHNHNHNHVHNHNPPQPIIKWTPDYACYDPIENQTYECETLWHKRNSKLQCLPKLTENNSIGNSTNTTNSNNINTIDYILNLGNNNPFALQSQQVHRQYNAYGDIEQCGDDLARQFVVLCFNSTYIEWDYNPYRDCPQCIEHIYNNSTYHHHHHHNHNHTHHHHNYTYPPFLPCPNHHVWNNTMNNNFTNIDYYYNYYQQQQQQQTYNAMDANNNNANCTNNNTNTNNNNNLLLLTYLNQYNTNNDLQYWYTDIDTNTIYYWNMTDLPSYCNNNNNTNYYWNYTHTHNNTHNHHHHHHHHNHNLQHHPWYQYNNITFWNQTLTPLDWTLSNTKWVLHQQIDTLYCDIAMLTKDLLPLSFEQLVQRNITTPLVWKDADDMEVGFVIDNCPKCNKDNEDDSSSSTDDDSSSDNQQQPPKPHEEWNPNVLCIDTTNNTNDVYNCEDLFYNRTALLDCTINSQITTTITSSSSKTTCNDNLYRQFDIICYNETKIITNNNNQQTTASSLVLDYNTLQQQKIDFAWCATSFAIKKLPVLPFGYKIDSINNIAKFAEKCPITCIDDNDSDDDDDSSSDTDNTQPQPPITPEPCQNQTIIIPCHSHCHHHSPCIDNTTTNNNNSSLCPTTTNITDHCGCPTTVVYHIHDHYHHILNDNNNNNNINNNHAIAIVNNNQQQQQLPQNNNNIADSISNALADLLDSNPRANVTITITADKNNDL